MKKLFVTVLLVVAGMASVNAQEAFKHLGIGVEVGTTGAGLELALPIVTDHLVLTAGYNFPSITVNKSFNFSTKDINASVNEANAELAKIPGNTEKISTFTDPTSVSTSIKGNLNNARIMLEYYPAAKSSFHIVAGVFIGNEALLSVSASLQDTFMNEYHAAQSQVKNLQAKYPTANIPSLDDPKFNMDGKTYSLSTGKAVLNANVAKAKPYFGIGFGRSIPDNRVGFQFELGAWYHGKAKIGTTNAVMAYDSGAPEFVTKDITDITNKFAVYPALTFRLTVKLF